MLFQRRLLPVFLMRISQKMEYHRKWSMSLSQNSISSCYFRHLLADTLGEPMEGLADVGDNFPDICEDDLLDIIKDETSVPHMEKNDTTRDDEKDMVLKTPELDPLARIFRF
ncbi:hypothetical protein Tco_0035939, partial [Tanacetum coccineum]